MNRSGLLGRRTSTLERRPARLNRIFYKTNSNFSMKTIGLKNHRAPSGRATLQRAPSLCRKMVPTSVPLRLRPVARSGWERQQNQSVALQLARPGQAAMVVRFKPDESLET